MYAQNEKKEGRGNFLIEFTSVTSYYSWKSLLHSFCLTASLMFAEHEFFIKLSLMFYSNKGWYFDEYVMQVFSDWIKS